MTKPTVWSKNRSEKTKMKLDLLHYEELEANGKATVGTQISCSDLFSVANHFRVLPSEVHVCSGAGEQLSIHVPKGVKRGEHG